VIQNAGLAAKHIWQARTADFEAKGRAEGVFCHVVLVLPLVFHQAAAKGFVLQERKTGRVYKALATIVRIIVGLRLRMQAMSDRTAKRVDRP